MRLFGKRSADTGCSASSPRTSVAIASASGPEQLPAALALAQNGLKAAEKHDNELRVVLLGAGLSSSKPASVANVRQLEAIFSGDGLKDTPFDRVDLVLSADDLSFLRLVPSAANGELCRVPEGDAVSDEAVEATIACLLRPPPVEYNNVLQLPLPWREHVRNLQSFKWLEQLWAQTKRDRAKEGATVDARANPADLLTLCMYAKVASVAMRTMDSGLAVLRHVVRNVPGAVDSRLLEVFGDAETAANAPSTLSFVEPFLLGDDRPWVLTARGSAAASAAKGVLSQVFDHATKVGTIMKKGNIAMLVKDVGSDDSVLVVDAGRNGDVGKILSNKTPTVAQSQEQRFVVAFKAVTNDQWPTVLNDEFHEVVNALVDDTPMTPVTRSRLGAFAALSSSHLYIDPAVKDANDAAMLSNDASTSVVTTHPKGVTAHVARQLTIRSAFMHVDACLAMAVTQDGPSVGCTIATFCSGTAVDLATPDAKEFDADNVDVQGLQKEMETIATALETPSQPLGVLRGTLGGVVEVDGVERRLCCWRRGNDPHDSFVTLLPAVYVNIAFADYSYGSRALDPGELASPYCTPFLIGDTLLPLLKSAAVTGANELAYRVSGHMLLPKEEAELHSNLAVLARNGIEPGTVADIAGGVRVLAVREANNDRLTGVGVVWAKHPIAGGGELTTLVAQNGALERVAF